jgi:hypothetical protein
MADDEQSELVDEIVTRAVIRLSIWSIQALNRCRRILACVNLFAVSLPDVCKRMARVYLIERLGI